MDYDIVIATRNRPDILRVSIPLMLSQSRRPRRLIVVDSSDDPAPVERSVSDATAGTGIETLLLRSAPGLTHQRNVGLAEVRSQVVMYPDDDSLWLPGVAEAKMRAYELDTEGTIGAICAAESLVPPDGVLPAAQQAYSMSAKDRLKLKVAPWANRFERKFIPDPFLLHGRSRWTVRQPPTWLASENVVLVEWMTGFRMSFRTDVIRATGFDETFRAYGQFEDVESSFNVMKTHLIVGARNARVFHYRAPGKRAHGLRSGACQILDRAYIVCKHSPPGSDARNMLKRYARFKIAQYAFGCKSQFGRERLVGATRALRRIDAVASASREEVSNVYLAQLAECTNGA